MQYKIPRALFEVADVFFAQNYEAYLVGGAVRDYCLGKRPSDFDIATNARPQIVMSLFKKVLPTGIDHGTVTILYKGLKIECTTFRSDGKYSDSRHPDSVQFGVSIDEDLARRDLTINAMAISLQKKKILDLYNGQSDLKARMIRTVGNAVERFTEDPLRMLRAVRFAATLNFDIAEETFSAVMLLAGKITVVSLERIRDELIKILLSENCLKGLQLLFESGLLKIIIPELVNCAGITQGKFHRADVLNHCFYVCAETPPEIELRLAGLLHDIGKSVTKTVDEETGAVHFYRHEHKSEEMVEVILRRLKFPNKVIEKVCLLIKHHMFNYTSNWRDSTIRKFIAHVGVENVYPILQLRLADIKGLKTEYGDPSKLLEFQERIENILKEQTYFSLKDLAINGTDLMELGVPAGKVIGQILQELLQTVLDDPVQNNRETLLNIAVHLKEKYKVE